MSDANNLVKQAIDAYKANDKAKAKALLLKAVDLDERNEQAWMWMSAVVDTVEEQQICLENVLSLNPNNDRARKGLAVLKQKAGKPAVAPPPPPPPAAPPLSGGFDLGNNPFAATSGSDPWGTVASASPPPPAANPFGSSDNLWASPPPASPPPAASNPFGDLGGSDPWGTVTSPASPSLPPSTPAFTTTGDAWGSIGTATTDDPWGAIPNSPFAATPPAPTPPSTNPFDAGGGDPWGNIGTPTFGASGGWDSVPEPAANPFATSVTPPEADPWGTSTSNSPAAFDPFTAAATPAAASFDAPANEGVLGKMAANTPKEEPLNTGYAFGDAYEFYFDVPDELDSFDFELDQDSDFEAATGGKSLYDSLPAELRLSPQTGGSGIGIKIMVLVLFILNIVGGIGLALA